MAVLFGCSGGEWGYETRTLRHGVLSYFLIKGLGGEADADRDGKVTQRELVGYLRREVSGHVRTQLKQKQTPELIGQTGDWPLTTTRGMEKGAGGSASHANQMIGD